MGASCGDFKSGNAARGTRITDLATMRLISMRKVSLLGWIVLAGASGTATATEVGYWPWYARVQGEVQHLGRPVSLRDEMGFRNSASHGFLIDQGWLRLSYMPMDYAAFGTLSEDTTFGGTQFSSDTQVYSTADITDLGARFLWPLLDGRLGVGGSIKILDGEVEVSEAEEDGQSDSRTFSEVFPTLSLQYDQPVMDLFSLGLEANYIGYEDQWILELDASISVQTRYTRIGFGFHQKEYDLEENGSALKAKAKGLYARLIFDLG